MPENFQKHLLKLCYFECYYNQNLTVTNSLNLRGLIMPMQFSSWNIKCYGQKEPIKVQFFRLLSALMKVHPIPHAIFETIRSGFIQILHHCSVWWKITPPCFCSPNLIYFGQKEPIEKEIFLSGWVKIHHIPHVIFETTSEFFFKLCITLQCHER